MPSQLDTLGRRKKPSQLDPYLDQIAELAAQGMSCAEIVKALNLPVQREQVRRQMRRYGIPLLAKAGSQPGPKNPGWKGGRRIDKDGYVLIRMPDHPQATKAGYVREHRLVMEQHLGRYLEPQEVVHHINGHKADNRIENLQLFASNAEHLHVTLAGQLPIWSPEGWDRIIDSCRRKRKLPDAELSDEEKIGMRILRRIEPEQADDSKQLAAR